MNNKDILKSLLNGKPKDRQKAIEQLKQPLFGVEVEKGKILQLDGKVGLSNYTPSDLVTKDEFLKKGGKVVFTWSET